MNRYEFEAAVTGTCSIEVFANSKEEACEKINQGNWHIVAGTQETDVNVQNNTKGGYLDFLLDEELHIAKPQIKKDHISIDPADPYKVNEFHIQEEKDDS